MDGRLHCQICDKTFTQKSSLIRHSKRCTPGPAPSLRQKSCRQCTSSKTKCDLERPRCSRCEQRGIVCEYIIPMTRGVRTQLPVEVASHADTIVDLHPPSSTLEITNPSVTVAGTDFNVVPYQDPLASLAWNFEADMFGTSGALTSTSQYNSVVPLLSSGGTDGDYPFLQLWDASPPKSPPPLVKHAMETILRVMKTWPKALAKGFQTPPMFHFTHTQPQSMLWPTANALLISRTWATQDSDFSETMSHMVLTEMLSLFEQYRSMDERHLLATLQALVVYAIILMFPRKGQIGVSLVDPAIFQSLQRVVYHVAKTGLLLAEERDCVRPSWQGWVHVTSKRRAIFSLYLLHWSYAVYHGLESFACSQLGFMPAPAAKFLWQAETVERWEELYDRWLTQWDGDAYLMSEFANIQPGTTLEPRTERWLEDADELGVLFFTIVNSTDRGDPWYYRNVIPVLTSESFTLMPK